MGEVLNWAGGRLRRREPAGGGLSAKAAGWYPGICIPASAFLPADSLPFTIYFNVLQAFLSSSAHICLIIMTRTALGLLPIFYLLMRIRCLCFHFILQLSYSLCILISKPEHNGNLL